MLHLLWWLLALRAAVPPVLSPPRVVVIGDVHGDIEALTDCLAMGNVTDSEGKVRKGTILVQTGDLVDRGWFSDLAVRRAVELKEQGEGRVVLLLGNHELLALQGVLEYANPVEVDRMGGTAARRSAFAPGGELGNMLLRHFRAAYIFQDTLFVHAGLVQEDAAHGVAGLNERLRNALENQSWEDPLLSADGPFWNREMLADAAKGRCDAVEGVLNAVGKTEGVEVSRVVVGHTMQKGGVSRRYCGGKVVAVDVGMSNGTGAGYKRRAVTVIDGNRVETFYAGQAPPVPFLDDTFFGGGKGSGLLNQGLLFVSFLATIVTPCVAAASAAFLAKVMRRMRIPSLRRG